MNTDSILALGIDHCIQNGGRCEECDDLRNCPDGRMLMQQRRLRMVEELDNLDRELRGDD